MSSTVYTARNTFTVLTKVENVPAILDGDTVKVLTRTGAACITVDVIDGALAYRVTVKGGTCAGEYVERDMEGLAFRLSQVRGE